MSNSINHDDIDRWFTHHPPTAQQVAALSQLRAKARELAHLIRELTPGCADQCSSLRRLRECVMTANAAVVIPPRPKSVRAMEAEPHDPKPPAR